MRIPKTLRSLFSPILLLLSLASSHAFADDTAVLSSPTKKWMEGFEFESHELDVQQEEDEGSIRPFISLRGSFNRQDWTLTIGTKKVKLEDSMLFKIKIPLTDEITEITIVAIGPRGEVEKQPLAFTFKN